MFENNLELPAGIADGEMARLIPAVADSSKEKRVTSVLLSTFMAVDEYGKRLLSLLGAPCGSRAKINCFTEITFEGKGNDRPDGLIQVTSGGKTWKALVEAKLGTVDLDAEQIERYLDLARTNGIQTVVTISNQFVTNPKMHPVKVNGNKTRTVSLFHWSWQSLLSEAILFAEHKGVSDPDQAYILRELIRYLIHQKSGVLAFERMPQNWKPVCEAARNNETLSRNAHNLDDIVGAWLQLEKNIALDLSVATGSHVSVHLSKACKNDPKARHTEILSTLIEKYTLYGEFSIPDAAARLQLYADLGKHTLECGMWLKAPKDKARATACVTWLKNQLAKAPTKDISICASFPGKRPSIHKTLKDVLEDPKSLTYEDQGALPTWFKISKIVKPGRARFGGMKNFVTDIKALSMSFYGDIGQNLKVWVPPAPKVVILEKDGDEDC